MTTVDDFDSNRILLPSSPLYFFQSMMDSLFEDIEPLRCLSEPLWQVAKVKHLTLIKFLINGNFLGYCWTGWPKNEVFQIKQGCLCITHDFIPATKHIKKPEVWARDILPDHSFFPFSNTPINTQNVIENKL